MSETTFIPDSEDVFEYLKEKKEGDDSGFSTFDMRQFLSGPTEPLNRMLLDLTEEGYVKPTEYDLSKNHRWEVVSTCDLEREKLDSCLGEYHSSFITPDNFRRYMD